jgi:hypothetical protein
MPLALFGFQVLSRSSTTPSRRMARSPAHKREQGQRFTHRWWCPDCSVSEGLRVVIKPSSARNSCLTLSGKNPKIRPLPAGPHQLGGSLRCPSPWSDFRGSPAPVRRWYCPERRRSVPSPYELNTDSESVSHSAWSMTRPRPEHAFHSDAGGFCNAERSIPLPVGDDHAFRRTPAHHPTLHRRAGQRPGWPRSASMAPAATVSIPQRNVDPQNGLWTIETRRS